MVPCITNDSYSLGKPISGHLDPSSLLSVLPIIDKFQCCRNATM